jgi:alpha-tubulin suppressor-like RCC1 family protein
MPSPVANLGSVVSFAGGALFSLAARPDGSVWTWGSNNLGQLGNGSSGPLPAPTPARVSGLFPATSVSAGGKHALARRSDGTVWAWGRNNFGQIGDGTNTNRNVPVDVSGLGGVAAIAGGAEHSLALKTDQTVWAWGDNSDGQLGNGTYAGSNVPVQVTGLTGVAAIACGYHHSLAQKADGTVYAWGWNGFRQLGNGSSAADSPVPVQVTDLTNVAAIAGGGFHNLARKAEKLPPSSSRHSTVPALS